MEKSRGQEGGIEICTLMASKTITKNWKKRNGEATKNEAPVSYIADGREQQRARRRL